MIVNSDASGQAAKGRRNPDYVLASQLIREQSQAWGKLAARTNDDAGRRTFLLLARRKTKKKTKNVNIHARGVEAVAQRATTLIPIFKLFGCGELGFGKDKAANSSLPFFGATHWKGPEKQAHFALWTGK